MSDFFDASFLAELEELAALPQGPAGRPLAAAPSELLSAFLAPPPDTPEGRPLTEEEFVGLPTHLLTARVNLLIELCRQAGQTAAVQTVDNFIVFFRALIPTLSESGSREIKCVFFRLVPTLIHVAYDDFGPDDAQRRAGAEALRCLERVLIEISGVRLAPGEGELVFRSIDEMMGFIGVGEYAMASEVIAARLLSIIERNKLLRALYRVMEAEVRVQRHLKERLGYPTPQIRLPDDLPRLTEYAPLRVFEEEAASGVRRRLIQVQLPDLPDPANVVLHVTSQDDGRVWELALDALGAAELSLPDGAYSLGLIYTPPA